MSQITREEFHDFKEDLFGRIGRVENKLDVIQTDQRDIVLEQLKLSETVNSHENFIGGAKKYALKGAFALVALLLFGQLVGQLGVKEAAKLLSALFGS